MIGHKLNHAAGKAGRRKDENESSQSNIYREIRTFEIAAAPSNRESLAPALISDPHLHNARPAAFDPLQPVIFPQSRRSRAGCPATTVRSAKLTESLISAQQQRLRDRNSQRLGGVRVDNQIKPDQRIS